MNFIYLKQYDDEEYKPLSTTTKAIDSDAMHVLSSVFRDGGPNSEDKRFLHSDIVLAKDTSLSLTYLDSQCSLKNTLFVKVHSAGSQLKHFSELSGDIFVVLPKATTEGLDSGMVFELPATYTTVEYKDYQRVSAITSSVLAKGTVVSFYLLAPFHHYVDQRALNEHTNDSVEIIHSNYCFNKGLNTANKTQVIYTTRGPRKHYLGFEDIPKDRAFCDRDYNDLVLELETGSDDAVVVVASEAENVEQSSVTLKLSASDLALFDIDLSGRYQNTHVFEHLDISGEKQSGGTRKSYSRGDSEFLWSLQIDGWVLKHGATHVNFGSRPDRPDDVGVSKSNSIAVYMPKIETFQGSVVDATDIHRTIPGVVITTTHHTGTLTNQSNGNGRYEINYNPDVVDPESFSHVLSHYGYVDVYTNTLPPVIPMSSQNQVPHFRFVLTWEAHPRDLDSHLEALQDQYHVFYNNRTITRSEQLATLDVDDVDAYGPETITLENPSFQTYRYYVHNYSNERTLSAARNVEVRVYKNNLLVQSINISGATNWDQASYRFWHVCDIVEQECYPVHVFLPSKP